MIVGTAGHIDHGKTSLVRSLTGVDTDRLKEEKARGISIDLGFAYLPAPNGGTLGFVDVPGHEKFIHNMLAGATGIDFVLFVVAADDGVMPQTREHLAIVDLLGIGEGLIAVTKSDLVSPEALADVERDIRALVGHTTLANAAIVPVSAATGFGVDDLRRQLFAAAEKAHARRDGGRFRLSVDRSFSLQGIGSVVTGTVLSGAVSVEDRVVVSPAGIGARVRSIHAQNMPVTRGRAGERCALNLAGDGIAKDAVSRGDMIVAPGLHAPTDRIDATFRALPSETRPLPQWMPVRLHCAASNVAARIVMLDEVPIAPGQSGLIQIVLERPIAVAVGDRFVLRDTTAQRTIGGGTFLDLRPPARRRRTLARRAELAVRALPDDDAVLAGLLDLPPFIVDLLEFARDRALTDEQVAGMTTRCHATTIAAGERRLAMRGEVLDTLKGDAATRLREFHAAHPDQAGMPLETLRRRLALRFPFATFPHIVEKLRDDGAVVLEGAAVRLPDHVAGLGAADKALWLRIAPLLGGEASQRPPRVDAIAKSLNVGEAGVRRCLKALSRMNELVEISKDRFFLREAVAAMIDVAAELCQAAPDRRFSVSEFRDRVTSGRNTAIEILEFFDRHSVTTRRDDRRSINERAADRFRRIDYRGPEQSANSQNNQGRESSPVGRPDFKSGKGRETALGGFDSLSLPPGSRGAS